MQSFHKTCLELPKEKGTLENIAGTVHNWLDSKRFLPKIGFSQFIQGTKIEQGKISLETMPTEDEEGKMFGVVLKHPDRKNQNLSWSTAVSIAEKPESNLVCTDLQAGFTDNTICPVDEEFFRPGIVARILRVHGSEQRCALSNQSKLIRFDEVPGFVKFLQDPKRKVPVLYLSRRIDSERPAIDPEQVADTLAGISHVVIGDGKYTDRKLGDYAGRVYSCEAGNARIYWPAHNATKTVIA